MYSASGEFGLSPGDPPPNPVASTPVDVTRPLSRQKVSASLEKLLGAGLSPTARSASRDRSSSREGLSSSGDELSPARENRDLTTSGEFERTNETNRSSFFEELWNPLEDDQCDDRPARPKSCDALSAVSLPLTSSDSRSRDELGTGLDSTEDELDSGIMDDDLPVELRRRHRSLSDRSSSRSLEDQLDFACVESGPRLNSEGMKHRIALTKQSVRNRRKPTRAGRRSQPATGQSAIPEGMLQRETLDPALLSKHTTPPISPSVLRKTAPSPKLRHTPPTTPGRSPVPSPRATPPSVRARLGARKDLTPTTPEDQVVKHASSPTVSLEPAASVSALVQPTIGATVTPPGAVFTPPGTSPPGAVITPPGAMVTPPVAKVTPYVAKVTPPVAVVTPSVTNVAPPGDMVTPPVAKVTPSVAKVTPHVAMVTPPVAKVTPSVAMVTPPVTMVTPPGSIVTPPVAKVTPSTAMVTPPVAKTTPLEPLVAEGPVMTPSEEESTSSRPRSVTEPPARSPDSLVHELKKRTASKEDLSPRPLTPRRAVLPHIDVPQIHTLEGAVTTETADSLSPEPRQTTPNFDTSPIRGEKRSPRSRTPEAKPKAKPKPNLPPKTSSPTWFDKIRMRKKAASIDIADSEPEVRQKTPKLEPKLAETSSEVIVQKPSAQKPSAQKPSAQKPSAEEGGNGTPPWLRETRLRRSASRNGKDDKKVETPEKPSWMREVLARRRKTQEKLNVGDFAEPEKSPQEKPTSKKTMSPLKTSTESGENKNKSDKTSKNNKNNVAKSLFKENKEKDRDLDSGTSSCEQSPLKRPTSLQKRDENVPPPALVTSPAITSSSKPELTSQQTGSALSRTSPLPPIGKTSASPAPSEKEIDTSIPAWKAELAIRKSQRKPPGTRGSDGELTSSEVPQWKRDLMEKKRAKTVNSDDDSALAGLPPWKQELMRKKKEKASNCGMIDGPQDQSQC